jgi:hypothetical protein
VTCLIFCLYWQIFLQKLLQNFLFLLPSTYKIRYTPSYSLQHLIFCFFTGRSTGIYKSCYKIPIFFCHRRTKSDVRHLIFFSIWKKKMYVQIRQTHLVIRVGRFLMKKSCWMRVPLESYSFLCESTENRRNKFLKSPLASRHLVKIWNIFFRTQSYHTSKDTELNIDFKNVILP